MGTRDQDYSLWTSMKARCANKNDKDYARYGGRGIKVCERWQKSFDDFMKDMGPRGKGLTLDRLNNDGNYEPKNCEWVDRATQAKNRGTTKHLAKTHEFDAEVFSVGKWNGDEFTKAHLDDMVSNFETLGKTIKPMVKFGHNDKQPLTDGKPALGWVTSLKRVKDKLIATLSDVPDVVYKALKSGLYKRVSCEMYFNYKHGDSLYKRVLTAVALLGADIPAVDNLADLATYLTQSTDKGSFEKVACFEISEPHLTKISDNKNHKRENRKMAEDKEYQKKYEAELQAKIDAETNAKLAEDTAKKYKAKFESQLAEIEKGTKAGRVESLEKFCEEQVKDLRMTPAGRDAIVKALDENTHTYAHETGFAIPVPVFEAFVKTYAKVIDPKEKGKGNGKEGDFDNVQTEVDFKVKAYMEDHEKIDYTGAMVKVLGKDADLAKRYRDDTTTAE